MAQLAQYSSLEQMTNVAGSVGQLVTASSLTQSVDLLGHELTFTRADGSTGTGVADGLTIQSGSAGARRRRRERDARRGHLRRAGTGAGAGARRLQPPDDSPRPERPEGEDRHHDEEPVRRDQRPEGPPDDARRDRERHRERQHRRVQELDDELQGRALAAPGRRERPVDLARRHERPAGRPRRPDRRDREPDTARARSSRPATRSTSRSRARAGSASPASRRPATPPTFGTVNYTRAGNFTTDADGNLVTQDGSYVLGHTATSQGPPPVFGAVDNQITIPAGATSLSIGQDGIVSYIDASTGANDDARAAHPREVPERVRAPARGRDEVQPSRRTPARRRRRRPGRHERPRHARVGLARDVERRPREGVHEHDRGAARLPGERPRDLDRRPDAPGPREPGPRRPFAHGGGRRQRPPPPPARSPDDPSAPTHPARPSPSTSIPDIIQAVESTPDTVIAMTNGSRLVVAETADTGDRADLRLARRHLRSARSASTTRRRPCPSRPTSPRSSFATDRERLSDRTPLNARAPGRLPARRLGTTWPRRAA